LVFLDAAQVEALSMPASAAPLEDNHLVFQIDPLSLPLITEIRWRDRGTEVRLAGPCSPIELRDRLFKGDMEGANRIANPDNDVQ
jgi:hypothetical protein